MAIHSEACHALASRVRRWKNAAMATVRLVRVDPLDFEIEQLEPAASLLRAGGLVAFPTETVYGLGADARNAEAVDRIFRAKERPADNPLIVHVESLEQARRYAKAWPDVAERLAAAFWPGPLTLVVPKGLEIPDIVTAGLPAVGLRMPAHPVAHALIRLAGIPIAAPSANPYMSVSPTTAEHVQAGLGDRVDLVVDGGPAAVGIESSVLDLTGETPVLLRPGGVSLEAIQAIAPDARMRGEAATEGPQRSPGLARRHYSPKASLRLFDDRLALLGAIPAENPEALALMTLGAAPATILPVRLVEMPRDAASYAARLYATLHELDAQGARTILVEQPPDTPDWRAVRDRLKRAAER